MHVALLELTDFRSYSSVTVELGPGVTAFIGANGQGKTNLVEAIDYLATLDSHRVASDAPMIRAGADSAFVRATLVKAERQALVELQITAGKSNRARLNQNPLPRVRDLIGVARSVIFSPEDLALVKGDPSGRRLFLDTLLVQRTPRLAGVRADYDRVLKQRNSLLKSARMRRNADLSTLEIWDEQLARFGGELIARRLRLLDDLVGPLHKAYAAVADAAAEDRRQVQAQYRPSIDVDPEERDIDVISKALLVSLEHRRGEEIDRGLTLCGPHRDDVVLSIGQFAAKGYASHGETWSLALALKLAAFELLRDDGDDPILILDDVFAELDTHRRGRLAELVASAEQVLITAAVAADVPEQLTGRRFRVTDGQVLDD
jgi:DNA replication and repair protein RecF